MIKSKQRREKSSKTYLCKCKDVKEDQMYEIIDAIRNYIKEGRVVNISFSLHKNKDKDLKSFFKYLRKLSKKKKKKSKSMAKMFERVNTQEQEEIFRNYSFQVNYDDDKENSKKRVLNPYYHVGELLQCKKAKKQKTRSRSRKKKKEKNLRKVKSHVRKESANKDLVIENFGHLPSKIQQDLKYNISKITEHVQVIEDIKKY